MAAYLKKASIAYDKKGHCFAVWTGVGRSRIGPCTATSHPHGQAAGERHGRAACIYCHTFRATGITPYLDNGGTIEKTQAIAALNRRAPLSSTTEPQMLLP